MKISELQAKLEDLKAEHGDIDTVVQTLAHSWEPDPVVKQTPYGKVLRLNP
jgi:hypothetical protein